MSYGPNITFHRPQNIPVCQMIFLRAILCGPFTQEHVLLNMYFWGGGRRLAPSSSCRLGCVLLALDRALWCIELVLWFLQIASCPWDMFHGTCYPFTSISYNKHVRSPKQFFVDHRQFFMVNVHHVQYTIFAGP